MDETKKKRHYVHGSKDRIMLKSWLVCDIRFEIEHIHTLTRTEQNEQKKLLWIYGKQLPHNICV